MTVILTVYDIESYPSVTENVSSCTPISFELVGETVNIVVPLDSTDVVMLTSGDET